ncbi:hypothetical protein F5Y11DRAFT_342160 [Daldinia sp. FL1419]|nr:hypothetical protein F5Y11DRAFT_342160 [Daldinia sp. FL1419]
MAQAKATFARRAVFGDRLSELVDVFIPPCSTTWLLTTAKLPSQYPPFPTTGPASCDPPLWTDNISQEGFGYYSPAICPSGFAVGCAARDVRSGEGFPIITAEETAMYCVPSGFTCTSDTTDFRGGVWGFMRLTSAAGVPVTVGPAIQIRWRAEDLSLLATDPLSPGLPATPTDVLTPASTSSAFPDVSTPAFTTLPLRVSSTALQVTSLSPTTEIEVGESPTSSEPDLLVSKPEEPEIPTTLMPLFSTDESTRLAPTRSSSTSPAKSGAAADRGGDGGNATSSTASSANTAAMALSGVLIGIILGYFATTTIRRYRQYRTGKVERFFPLDLGALAGRILAGGTNRIPSHPTTMIQPPRYPNPGAELGTDGPIPEIGSGSPLGTKENPAELGVNSARNSWVSRVSRIFTVKLTKETWPV